MFRPWLRLSSVMFLIVAILVSARARADEPEPDPGSVFKTHGLKAAGWVYVLETESNFHSKVIDTRSLYHEWMTARSSLIELEQEAEAIQQLTQQTTAVKQNIAQIRQQMSRSSYGGRRASQFRQMQNMEMTAEVNQEQMALNQMTQQLTQLKKNVPKPADKKKLQDEESGRRDKVHDAVTELGQLSDSIDRTYQELHGAKEVETALIGLGRSGGTKLKLGPSREYLADVKIVHKLRHELAVAGSPVAGASKSATKRPSKGGQTSKKKSTSGVKNAPAESSTDS